MFTIALLPGKIGDLFIQMTFVWRPVIRQYLSLEWASLFESGWFVSLNSISMPNVTM